MKIAQTNALRENLITFRLPFCIELSSCLEINSHIGNCSGPMTIVKLPTSVPNSPHPRLANRSPALTQGESKSESDRQRVRWRSRSERCPLLRAHRHLSIHRNELAQQRKTH